MSKFHYQWFHSCHFLFCKILLQKLQKFLKLQQLRKNSNRIYVFKIRKSAVKDFKSDIMRIFFLEEKDFENTPPYMCLACHAKMGNMKRACSTAKLCLSKWGPHQKENCLVCDRVTIKVPKSKVGRTAKQRHEKIRVGLP